MDVILDEARKRNMKVWILDDSHFPTGYANGAVKDAPVELHRQSLCAASLACFGPAQTVELNLEGMIPPEFHAMTVEQYFLPELLKKAPHFSDDEVLSVTAFCKETGEQIGIPLPMNGEKLRWEKPEGDWVLWILGLSRNCGPHRDYINMMDQDSCRLLIDAVYESHFQHYAADFGTTIAGFFSDEPELGNGHLYFNENILGTDQDLPFSAGMPEKLVETLGEDWKNKMFLLWQKDADASETARVRYAYMDAVTKLVRENFSRQIGDWCREHGVEYIGHVIEDNNAHARTGSSLGHYFRGLDGQDMAGIDNIGGQVMPQGEDEPKANYYGAVRDGEFYHFQLANLAASAAAIQPEKQGRAMCEIFGNYGWGEGVRLEKYLADHFLVRGFIYFVPHAFSPAPFPDPDAPPHFYAHGNNPQYRHFGMLMAYMNRAATILSGGHRNVPVAILYHGEAEWTGEAMLSQKPARLLAQAQIEYDTIPADVFAEPDHYGTVIGKTLRINTQEYKVLLIPKAQFVTADFAKAAAKLSAEGMPVYFLDAPPIGIVDGDDTLLKELANCKVLPLDEVVSAMKQLGLPEAEFYPGSRDIRAMHYEGSCSCWLFVNESAEVYSGTVTLPDSGPYYRYDAWNNTIHPVEVCGDKISIRVEPLHSFWLIPDIPDESLITEEIPEGGKALTIAPWHRSICRSADYPNFGDDKEVCLPDCLEEEVPEFSGFVRYESTFHLENCSKVYLVISEAWEGVEVFVNGHSGGIQIAAPYRYDLTPLVKTGENELIIEVATTLERWWFGINKDNPQMRMMGLQEPACGSGITGKVMMFT